MLRGIALKLYRDTTRSGDDAVNDWVDNFMASTPRGRLETVQALNICREFTEASSEAEERALDAALLAAAKALRNREPAAARLLRDLPALSPRGLVLRAALEVAARSARPV